MLEFDYTITPNGHRPISRLVMFVPTAEGIRVSAYDSECDAEYLLKPEHYAAFNAAIGASADADPMAVAREGVAAGRQQDVNTAARENADVLFTWYEFDSAFYGD